MNSKISRTLLAGAFVASGCLATGVGTLPAAAAPASGTCTIKTNLWTNSDDEIINDATATCNKAKSVSVRSRLYYCNWVAGGSRSYVLKDTKTSTSSKKVTVVEKAMFGKWYGEAYVYYTKGGVKYSKSVLEFGSVGGRPDNADC